MEHFDFERLKKYLDNDKVVLKGFLNILKKELYTSHRDLTNALNTNNLTKLHETNHKLKGTAVTASLPQVDIISSELSAMDAIDQEKMQNILDNFQKEIDILIPMIDEMLAQI